jgi:uncharacterized membrane protein
MITSINAYLDELKTNLNGCDPATLRDALSDAEEYLRNGFETVRETQPDITEEAALVELIEDFGSPEEFAADYKIIEARVKPLQSPSRGTAVKNPVLNAIFGIFADPVAWSSLLFMILSLVTGIFYFTWAVTGLSLSAGLIVLIIGIPFMGLFFLSVRGIGLVEGRIVEALLGVRMPRRPVFVDNNVSWWTRFKVLFTSRHTWFALVYMILMLPLGSIYFTLFVTLVSVALAFLAAPIVQVFLPFPMVTIGFEQYYLTPGFSIPCFLIGFALSVATLNLAKLIGGWHGSLAKAMLVSE